MRRGIVRAIPPLLVLVLAACPLRAEVSRLTITGRVIDRDTGTPVPGAFVEIENASGGSGYSRAHTDGSGGFAFQDLPGGVSYNLYVEKEGFTSYRRLYWFVEADKQMESMVVPLSKEGVLTCRVTASDGATPLARVRVTLKPMGWRKDPYAVYEFEKETDNRGGVGVAGIAEGVYELVLEKEGYIVEKLTNLSFRPGSAEDLHVPMYRPGSISGRVLLRDERAPLAGITLVAGGPCEQTATSNIQGVYSLRDLKPGTYGFAATRTGFRPYRYEGAVTIEEGENRKDVDHFLEADREKVAIAIYQEVYPKKERMAFAVRAFRSEDFTLEFYRIPVDWYLESPHKFAGLLAPQTPLDGFDKVHSARFGFDRYRPYTWFTREVRTDKPLTPGIYLIRAATPNAQDRRFVFVSDLGVVVKRGRQSLLAYTVNFQTNRPEPEVELVVLKSPRTPQTEEDASKSFFKKILSLFTNDRVLFRGKTDDQGLLELIGKLAPADVAVLALKSGCGIGIAESYLSHMAASQGWKAYLYTDRPVYRPGHRVFFKGIFRMDEGTALGSGKDREVLIEMKDGDGRLVATVKGVTDTAGTVNGSFDLSPDAPLGRYTLTVQGQSEANEAHFFVQAYRKPDFKVTVATDKEAYTGDETLRCVIQAAYFFGSPLADAGATYRVYQKMTAQPHYRFWWEGEYYRQEGFHSLIRSGNAVTDAQGFVSVEVVPPPKSYDRIITVEAEVAAPSGRKVSARKSVALHQSAYQIEVVDHPFVHKKDAPLELRIRVMDIQGRPVATRFTAALEQEIWNPIRSRFETPSAPLYSTQGDTDPWGNGAVEVPVSELRPGYVRFVFSCVDPKGYKAIRSASLWLYDTPLGDFDYNYTGLEIRLDRENYRAGETARLLMNTPGQHGTVLFTMEGPDVLEYRVLDMPARTRILEIPVKEAFAPNVWLSVVQHDGTRLHHKRVSLNVSVEGREMTLDTAFDRGAYRPGDKAVLRIKAKDPRGRPVQGDFSVGVVDEAVYYVRPDHTVPIHDFFYAKRPQWITTTYSFPIKYLGGAVKDPGDQPLRERFEDTALWLPNVATDKHGEARVNVPLPDNLTTWVATVRGHSMGNLFGEKKEKALVTKPLVTSLRLPRFFVRGDRTEVRAVTFNRTESPLEEVRTTVDVGPPLVLTGVPTRTQRMPRQGTGSLSWDVEVARGGQEAVVTARTLAGALQDAERQTVPVFSRGIPMVYDFAGKTRDGSVEVLVALPEDHVVEGTEAELEIIFHPALAGLTAVEYLARFPYGCVEQTLNRFVPLARYHAALARVDLVPEDAPQAHRRIEEGLAKLARFQKEGGGFGWWHDSQEDLYLTCLVLLGVSSLPDIPQQQTGDLASAAARYVAGELGKPQVPDMTALALFALAEAGQPQRSLVKALARRSAHMDALTLSLTILALERSGMKDEAVQAASLLLEKLEKTNEGSFFPETGSYRERVAVETNALALWALARTLPGRGEIEDILQWLLSQRTGPSWISTRTTGWVVMALCAVLETLPQDLALQEGSVTVFVNDRQVGSLAVSPEKILREGGLTLGLAGADLVHGTNRVRIVGDREAHYSLSVRSFVERDPMEPGSEGCRIALAKQIHTVARVHDSRGRPRILTNPLEPGATLHVGEEIQVDLRFAADRDYRFFVLEDALPSGFEVADFDADTDTAWWRPYSHKERRNNKVVYFFDALQKNREVTVQYILRSELNGLFHVPPARLFGMYHPRIFAHSASATLRVGAAGSR